MVLKAEKPDVVFANTDPRYLDYLFKMDNEIRSRCPLVFYHLWDDFPFPDYNVPAYKSCDRIITGSKFTYDLLLSEKDTLSDIDIDYVPIGFDPKVYKPLSREEKAQFRKTFNERTNNEFINAKFIIGVVGRHMFRKELLSIIDAFSRWQKDKDGVALFIHSPGHDEGGSLGYTIKKRYGKSSVILSDASSGRINDNAMNMFYNFFDVLVNRSSAEGFGMPIAEAMLAGTPSIAVDCAGPQGLITPENGWLLKADVKPMTGNATTPYIQIRYVTDEKFLNALDEAYYKRDVLQAKAAKCREYIVKNYNIKQMVEGIEKSLKSAFVSFKRYPEYTIHTWPKVKVSEDINVK
jgi:glycosyltransferase involved in cell wall biosynthesis